MYVGLRYNRSSGHCWQKQEFEQPPRVFFVCLLLFRATSYSIVTAVGAYRQVPRRPSLLDTLRPRTVWQNCQAVGGKPKIDYCRSLVTARNTLLVTCVNAQLLFSFVCCKDSARCFSLSVAASVSKYVGPFISSGALQEKLNAVKST